MTYSTMLYDMWVLVFGDIYLGGIALIVSFYFLCWKRGYDIDEHFLVVFPVVSGIVADGAMPLWIKGMYIVGVGVLWFSAITKKILGF